MLPAFLVYIDDLKSFKDVIPKDDFADAIWAVAEYTETGEEADGLSPMATVLFRMIKAKVDRESEKYERKCEAGAKGGRPKKEETNGNQTKPTKTNENQEKPTETNGKEENQKEKETEIETEIINNTTNAHAHAETPFGEVDLDPLIIKIQRELNGLTDTHMDLLRQYRDELGDDLVSYAIDQAVANGIRNWAYVERILITWGEKGLKTIGEVKAENERRRAKNKSAPPQKPGKVVTAAKFSQREYPDDQWSGVDGAMAEALKKVMSG